MNSLFPYLGGKHRVAGRIAELFPEHTCYAEVFAGALNVFFAKPPSKCEVVNDTNQDLIRLFRVLRWHKEEFLHELAFLTASRQEFQDCKQQRGLTDIQRAARYWMLLKAAFGGKTPECSSVFGYATLKASSVKWSGCLETLEQAHKRLEGAYIENLDFADLIGRYDRRHTLFFCDPPYWQTADYGSPFPWEDHLRLADQLSGISGKFFLTINDHSDIRKLYAKFRIQTVQTRYTVSREKTDAAGIRGELWITNYPPKAGKR